MPPHPPGWDPGRNSPSISRWCSTAKKKSDPPGKYVEAFAGADIETNPPGTNDAVEATGRHITAHITELPPQAVLDEIKKKVDFDHLEATLMSEGTAKFAEPHKALIALIGEKRKQLKSAHA